VKNSSFVGVHGFVDMLIWYGFLILLYCLSFVTDHYASASWMMFSAVLYLFAASYFGLVLLGVRSHFRALIAARYAIVAWAMILVIHALQLVLPIATPIHDLFSNRDIYAPSWYQPDLALSLVPHRTQWFLMRELMVTTVFVLTLLLVDSRRRLKHLLWLMLIVGASHAVIAIFAKFGNVHLVDIKTIDGHSSPARGLFVNRNHLSAFVGLCLAGPIALQLYWFIKHSGRRSSRSLLQQSISKRFIVILALIISLSAMVLSQSRAGILAFAVSLSLVLLMHGKRVVGQPKLLRLLAPMIGLCLALMIYFGAETMQKFGASGLSIGERGAQWALTWQAIKESILFGYGVGSYASVFQIFRDYADFRQVTFDQSHNDFLHIWLEQGALGLAIWVLFLFIVIRSSLLSLSKTESTLATAVLLACIMVLMAALMQSSVDFNLQISNIRCYFFVIIALAFAAPKVRHHKRH